MKIIDLSAKVRRLVKLVEELSTEDLNAIIALKSFHNYAEFVVDTMDPREGFNHVFDDNGVLFPPADAALEMGEDMYCKNEQEAVLERYKKDGIDLTKIYSAQRPPVKQCSVVRTMDFTNETLWTKEYK